MPRIFLNKPEGMGKVMKGEHRFNVVADKYIYDFLIIRYSFIIPDFFAGLYPAPFEEPGINREVL